ncbi:D-alanyl-D-alanine carboxypeptidase [Mesobacillus campisalis]|uniref:D-alanyl-D-alanine carboxypeptidase n=1 Tax=Mesobacillus campisalis TaxID=1408103 RepID=A0A0M2T1A2_9BACI|nr:D-alanyl-D-alanine carboxypeptidase/D-alanyl-D-alanine-endopeptidase [Mesobacillus campisalis]KKK38605.1 D-alanyl-D-alanine carboxypeptidase [Mesobacillus campisalis]
MRLKKVLCILLVLFFFLSLHTSSNRATNEIEKTKVVSVAAQPAGKEMNSELETLLESVKQDERLNGSVVGISIRKGSTGEILYSSLGETRLHPASNQKLLTAASALMTLGPDYTFSTEVWADGKIKNGVLHGNLYLRGKGDPTLLREDLVQFALDLKSKGIDRIDGDLIGDDSWFDDVRLSQDLNWSDEGNYTGAQVSALTLSPDSDFDTGTVLIETFPGEKAGKPGKIKVTPANEYIAILNKTVTVDAGEPRKLSVEREHGNNRIVISGEIPIKSKQENWVAVWEPAGYTVNVFKLALEQAGVSFSKDSSEKRGATPKKAKLLTSKASMPLKEILIPFMKLSNNGHGEILAKEMGKVVHGAGSWEKGLKVMEECAKLLGMNTASMLIRDGSGMSHKNMIPANEISRLLYAVQSEEWFPAFEKSLPVAGSSGRLKGGTLRSRLTGDNVEGRVKAKTGSITGVSSLSGYVTAKSGTTYIFSIMINNHLSPSVRELEDKIVTILAENG